MNILSQSLRSPIDGLWTITETRNLPAESKPSEIRENIALALSHASGCWVVPYIVEALAREEKSLRCRLELTRQLSKREQDVSRWFEMLGNVSWAEIWNNEAADRTGRLREITSAIATILREQRNTVSAGDQAGPSLAKMLQQIGLIRGHAGRNAKVIDAALAVIDLLDELLAIEFTLIADPDAYAPLAVVARWWSPSAYPSEIVEGLRGIVRKLTSAIRLRARLGQKSESLVIRLRQALGSPDAASGALLKIAETESGLAPDLDDWLRGRERVTSATADALSSLLSTASTPVFAEAVAALLLDILEANTALVENSDSPLAAHLRRINGRVQALAAELKLRPVGTVGDVVEFNPSAHRTVTGSIPPEPNVRLRRPMVVRLRDDGSQDIVELAVVEQS